MYFNKLNYSLSNEDSRVEFEIAKRNNPQSILSIAGSGSRCLPFLALEPQKLMIVDSSFEQILFVKLKYALIKKLDLNEYQNFFFVDDFKKREEKIELLDLKLDEIKALKLINFLNKNEKAYLWGTWEKTFVFFSKIVRFFFKNELLLNLVNSKDPYLFYKEHIDGLKWKLVLSLVGNKALFNALLYKGSFVKKNMEGSYLEYYYRAFDRLFKLDVKKSSFVQLCFLGEILYEDAYPLDFCEPYFTKIKNSKTHVEFIKDDILNVNGQYDLISLSNVPCYFSSENEKNYLTKLNTLNPKIIIERNYLREPKVNQSSFKETSQGYLDLFEKELVQMYKFRVFSQEEDSSRNL